MFANANPRRMNGLSAIERKRLQRLTCPNCGGHHISVTTASLGFAKCNDCDYSRSAIAVSQSGSGVDSLLGALVALGFIAIGAALVGALLDSLVGPEKKERLPNYDEENWQRVFR